MRTLSKEAEQVVINAIKQAVAFVDDDGMEPTAAMTKVAQQHQWGMEMIKFACSAYNTGRQTAQRERSTLALDKFADFPLADAAEVISAVFPSRAVKLAADSTYASISSEYQMPPQWLAHRASRDMAALHHSWRQKAAADETEKGKPGPSGDFDSQQRHTAGVYNQYLRLKRAAEDARYIAGESYDRLLAKMGQLAEYFKKSSRDRLPFAVVEMAAALVHKSAGQRLLDWVYQRNHMKEAKAANTKFASLIEMRPDSEPWNMLQQCIDAGQAVAEKRAAHESAVAVLERYVTGDQFAPLVSTVTQKQADWELMPQPAQRQIDRRTLNMFINRPAVKQAAQATAPPPEMEWTLLGPTEKKAGGLSDVIMGAGAKSMIDKAMTPGASARSEYDNNVRRVWQDLEDPAHEADLRRIRSQANLSDLMNDEVLSGYDPEQVLKGYNEVSQMAPRVAGQPLAIRALLRRHMQGNLEPHETQMITDIEKGLKDTTQLPTETTSPWTAASPLKKSHYIMDDANAEFSIL